MKQQEAWLRMTISFWIRYLKPTLLLDAAACELTDQVDLMLPVGCSIMTKDLVEPYRRLRQHIGMLPRVPRQVRLRLARDQAPVDGADVVLLRQRQRVVERAARAPRHEFRADDRPMQWLQLLDARLEVLRPTIVVKRNDVGLRKLYPRHRTHLDGIAPVVVPHAAGQGLRRLLFARPRKHLRQQRFDKLRLVLRLVEASIVGIVRFVPEVPRKNAVVLPEARHDALHIRAQFGVVALVRQLVDARALHPARVMYARD